MIKSKSNNQTTEISEATLSRYLSTVYACPIKILSCWRLDGSALDGSKDLKGFGYGFPFAIEFTMNGETKRVVLETMRPEGFGHDHFSDRAQIMLWQHSAFGKLPKHVRSVDVGAFVSSDKVLKSLGSCYEFFILTDFVEGKLYHLDLDRIKETTKLDRLDEQRCLALSDYLVQIHQVKRDAPWLYVRRARELVGHGECIMGLLDSYPPDCSLASESYLIDIERNSVVWRWRLKRMSHRLSQVHGDFHPWNVLFRKGTDFTVLDRSRGEWGEPADDLAAMSINYIFYSVQKYGQLTGVFERLFVLFWENYLEKMGDYEVLEAVPPFFAWRGLVVASPVWYPALTDEVRVKLLNFVKNVMQRGKFDFENVNSYF